MQKFIAIGRLTRDVELRYTPIGTAVAKTGFAESRKYKDKVTGETKEETMFIDIVIWGKSAEIFNQYCQKGHRVAIEGRLVLDQWEDKETKQKRSKHSIGVENFEFLENKADKEMSTKNENIHCVPGVSDSPKAPEINISDDEIPF